MSVRKKKVILVKKIKRKDLVVENNTIISDLIKKKWEEEKYRNGGKSINKTDQIIYKISVLIQLLKDNKKKIKISKSITGRRKLEIKQDVIKRYLEEYTIYAEDQEILQNEQTDFNYYPEINDENFSYKIALKKEFWKNKIPLVDLQYLEGNNSFKLFPHQKFVKNFISENTPYSGVLLWHGVGVGKSCAAISIAENFRDFMYYNDKKILVLTPSNTLIDNWRDEIFNLDKELNKTDLVNVQCTGSKYLNEFKDFQQKDAVQKARLVKSTINKYYEFMGYQKLYNSIDRDLQNQNKFKRAGIREIDRINYIKNRFSNRVIIMDEVHVTREGGSTKEDKKIRPYLEMIARYTENTKIILLTATPMYNISKEIIWLLNLLLWNDKLAPLEEHEIFDKDGVKLMDYDDDNKLHWNDKDSKYAPINWIKKKSDRDIIYNNITTGEEQSEIPIKGRGNMALSMLTRKARGYISYLRGEDPFRFPFKLYPTKNTYTPQPTLELKKNKWVELDKKKQIPNKSLIFYNNKLSDWQYGHLVKFLEISESDIGKSGQMSSFKFNQNAIQGSNIIFPDSVGDLGKIGEQGWDSCFLKKTINREGEPPNIKYLYKTHAENINSTNKSFLHLDNIGKYSKKFENIIKSIQTCEGIVFIFSQYIAHGIKSLAIALEENGFNKINSLEENTNFLENSNQKRKFCARNLKYKDELIGDDKNSFKQANYIYLDGTIDKKELTKLVRMERKLSNKNGENIKVILGSSVIEQGVSFHCIREVHVLDPWHHLNKLEQAVGRAFRSKSHFKLEKERRNITLFIHTSTFKNHTQESVDERIYRNAYLKKKHMSLVERQLKINSVDCFLNLKGNIFLSDNYSDLGDENPLSNINMIDSKGDNIMVDLDDKDRSIKCDFKLCNYNCYTKNSIDLNEIKNKINDDTFSEDFARDEIDLAKEYIKVLYLNESAYSLSNILDEIKEIQIEIDDKFIYHALHEIIINKELVYDLYYRQGHIIARNSYYIFQPDTLNDINLPYWYRIKIPEINNYSISLNDNYKKYKTVTKSKPTFNKIKKRKKKKNIIDISKIKKNINNAEKYILLNYQEYIDLNKQNDHIPDINDLIYAKKLSIMERLDYNSKKAILEDSLIRIISFEKKTRKMPLTDLDKLILKYYDLSLTKLNNKKMKNKILNHSILRDRRDIYERFEEETDSSIDNFPLYFRLVENNGKQNYYQYSEEEASFIPQNKISSIKIDKLNLKKIVIDVKTQIYGWIGLNSEKEKQFFIVNNTGYVAKNNEDGSVQEKSKRRGGICGHAKDCTRRPQIADTINKALNYEKYKSLHKPTTKLPAKKSNPNNPKKSLCEELELILRCKQFKQDELKYTEKFFFTFEEMVVNKNI